MNAEGSYDYVIVGAGAGGGVLAARLASAGQQVLVLEAGGDPLRAPEEAPGDRPLSPDYRVPGFHAFASENPGLTWDFWVRHYACTTRQEKDWRYHRVWKGETVDGVLYPRASGLGGCTAHNAMIVMPPNNADWNHISEVTGDASWRASNMRQYFRRIERCRYRLFTHRWLYRLFGWNPTGHGWYGWLTTERALPLRAVLDWRLRRALRKALIAASGLLPDVVKDWGWFASSFGDPNDERLLDAEAATVCVPPMSTACHARTGPREFLLDVQKKFPGNLTIRLNVLVTRVAIDPVTKLATGVFYREGNRLYRASARPHGDAGEEKFVGANREVILAGGAFNSPQLLMLSGIGDTPHLAESGIAVVKDLPGVGRNLQDRYEIGVVNRVRRPWAALRGAEYSSGDRQYRIWRWFRLGAYTSNGALFSAIFPSRTDRPRPDLFCFLLLADFRGYYPGYSERIRKRDYLSWVVLKAYNQNTAGTVRLRSNDALDRPAINFHSFSEGNCPQSDELDAVVTGIRFGREVADAIGDLVVEEETPGRHLFTDEQLKQHVADNAWGHHACGTCAMKPEDLGGVVDSRFRVHGIGNLRVVDASVFPRIPGYFIVTSIYMIAEKAADVLLADAATMPHPVRSSAMQPCLPHNDPNPQARTVALEARRREYFFNYTYIPGYPFLDHVPRREKFSLRYWAGRFFSLTLLPFNIVLGLLRTALINPVGHVSDFLNLYTLYRRPENIETWVSDDGFAEQRICGCNPQAIRRLDQVPAGFAFSDAQLQAVAGDTLTLASEAAAGTLYLADFEDLAHVKGSVYKGRNRTIPSPRALFWWNRADAKLHTVGIQVRRDAGSRIFTPSDPLLDWTAAKLAYQCADACHQEIGSHFAWSHMVMAPAAVITRRQLAEQHPVHVLLMPHFRFYLFDNELGRVAFINPGGPVEKMLGGTLQESLGIPLNLYKKWNIRNFALPAELARRGLANDQIVTRYPMRDDGLPIWHAIDEFVGNYLRIYYKSDADVAADQEIQSWARELASRDTAQNGGCIAGMPDRIDSIELLRELLTTIIWTCGPLHSMLNFSQWDYINLPNMSYAIYADVPEAVGATTYKTLMSMMPTFGQASYQLWWCKILTSYKYDKLGDYLGQFSAPEARLVVQMFHQRLQVIEKEIEARDSTRVVSFPYLKPSLCINSINT